MSALDYAASDSADDDFTVFFTPASHTMEYLVVSVAGRTECGKPLYGDDFSEDVDRAEILMRGFIKWDGCTDCTVGTGDDYQLHFCSLDNAMMIGRAIQAIYRVAAQQIPAWDRSNNDR